MIITLAMKAEAANKLEHIKYTGTSGLYSAVVPKPEYVERIMRISEELGLPTDEAGLHATVVYSKKAPSTQSVSNFDPTQEMPGIINAVESWVGHNDKTYIVLKVVSQHIVSQNASFQRMGAEHTFVPFAPHITLSDEVPVTPELKEKIDMINKRFAYEPLEVVFHNMIIGDLEP
jgi:hypothetical protein